VSERLLQLKQELQKGEQEMARLDRQRQMLRDLMLRISGAIQVLEELEAQPEPAEHDQPVLSAIA
jgi:prefoldin subunit 5